VVRGSLVWVNLDPAPRSRGAKDASVRRRFQNRGKRRVFDSYDRAALVGQRTRGTAHGATVLSAKEILLPKGSRALCDQVRTIDKRRIRDTVGVLSSELLGRIDRGLILHLELESYVGV
jgi:mRNA-degrading endonuclease toxin of MazEF toxin-antitoxin module